MPPTIVRPATRFQPWAGGPAPGSSTPTPSGYPRLFASTAVPLAGRPDPLYGRVVRS